MPKLPFLPSKKSPHKKESLEALWRLLEIMMADLNFDEVVYKIVNSILTELGYMNLGYRIVVLSLIDEKAGGLRRIALSQTEEAIKATSVSTVPFEKIVIPLSAKENLCVKVLYEGKPMYTNNWQDILTPPLTPEAATTNQKSAGIKTSLVYPVFSRGKPIGSLIFSIIKDYSEVSEDEKDLLSGFAELVGLATQNSMLYTSLKGANAELTSLTEQVTQANQKLKQLDQLKDDFVSIASHELRTPMTAIRSYAWMALNRSDVPLSEKMKKYLSRTLISTERLIILVNEMLNISRIESGRIDISPQLFEINSLVKDVFDEVIIKAKEKGVHLVMDKNTVPKVFADQNKVHQVLLNLIGNSLKFTPAQGTIRVSFFCDGKVVDVSIADNGVGISKDDLTRLFTKFGRLDNSYVAAATSGGTGLGLYISKSLIERMGGRIWANSEGRGKGTVFTFTLPVASKEVLDHPEKYRINAIGEAKGLEPVSI